MAEADWGRRPVSTTETAQEAAPFDEWVICEWRPVPDWEGLYEVSRNGLIRRVGSSRPLKPQPRPGGYWAVQFWRNNHATNVLVHCVVARAFIGAPPPGKEVNHKEGDKSRNGADDLEYLTRPENIRHAYRTGLHPVNIDQLVRARRKPRVTTACECGCGTAIETPDRKGRDRRYVHGHNRRRVAA